MLSTADGTVVALQPPVPLSEKEDSGEWIVDLVYDQPMGTYGVALLCLAGPGAARTLVVHNEWEEGPVAVARLTGARPEALVGPAVALALATNGTAFGVELMASLPSRLENHRPDLLPAAAVEQSLLAFLEWSTDEGWADTTIEPLEEDLGVVDDLEALVRRYMEVAYRELSH